MLISKRLAQWVCVLGLSQLLFATGLVVCGFIVLGLFNNVSCIGLWCGLPALLPGLLSVVVLGTRHTSASFMVFVTSLAMIGVGAWHAVEVYQENDFWEKFRGYAETEAKLPPCYHNGFHCLCHDKVDYDSSGYTVWFCDQFRVGEDLNWAMFILTLAIIFFSTINAVVSLVSLCMGRPEDKDIDDQQPPMSPPEYELYDKKTYPVTR